MLTIAWAIIATVSTFLWIHVAYRWRRLSYEWKQLAIDLKELVVEDSKLITALRKEVDKHADP